MGHAVASRRVLSPAGVYRCRKTRQTRPVDTGRPLPRPSRNAPGASDHPFLSHPVIQGALTLRAMISNHTWHRAGLTLTLQSPDGHRVGSISAVENGRWRVETRFRTGHADVRTYDSLAEAQRYLADPLDAALVRLLSPAAINALRRAGLMP